jgi:hypothetical protein
VFNLDINSATVSNQNPAISRAWLRRENRAIAIQPAITDQFTALMTPGMNLRVK